MTTQKRLKITLPNKQNLITPRESLLADTQDSNSADSTEHFSRRTTNRRNTVSSDTTATTYLPHIDCDPPNTGNIILKGRQNKLVIIRRNNKLKEVKNRHLLPPLNEYSSTKDSGSKTKSGSGRSSSAKQQESSKQREIRSRGKAISKRDFTPKATQNQHLTMMSFTDFVKKFQYIVDNVCYNFQQMERDIVERLVMYVSMLTVQRSDIVDESVFKALCMYRINCRGMPEYLKELYKVLAKEYEKPPEGQVRSQQRVSKSAQSSQIVKVKPAKDYKLTVEGLCSFLCVIITGDQYEKANMVFNVFDIKGSGRINERDITFFLKRTVETDLMKIYHGDLDEEDIEMDSNAIGAKFMKEFDRNGLGVIEKDEFVDMAMKSPLFLDAFGIIFPRVSDIENFVALLNAYDQDEMHAVFRYERRHLLRNPVESNQSFIQSLYPVSLQFS